MWAELTAALDGLGLAVPSGRALRGLRRRVGAAPLKALFEAGPGRGLPPAPGVGSAGTGPWHSMGAGDKGPGHARNRGWLGEMNASLGVTLPRHSAERWWSRHPRADRRGVRQTPTEITWARRLLYLLDAPMLVLMDRGLTPGSPTSRCAIPCWAAGYCARVTRPGWNRRCGHCWPSPLLPLPITKRL